MYAAASAALLGLGGWLVIQNQLTLGQLVAAELVLSAAFFGVAQLGSYLGYFYDLFAAVEEISHFYDVEQEQPKGADPFEGPDHTIVMKACAAMPGMKTRSSISKSPADRSSWPPPAITGCSGCSPTCSRCTCCRRAAIATLGGIDMKAIEAHHLRKNVHVLDRPSIVEMTIREYLALSCPDTAPQRMVGALETVGLADTIATLDKGLDTPLASTGYPLSAVELQQLKLANALLERPRILVLSRLFDLLDPEPIATRRQRTARAGLFDRDLLLQPPHRSGLRPVPLSRSDRQRYFDNFDEFCAVVNTGPLTVRREGRADHGTLKEDMAHFTTLASIKTPRVMRAVFIMLLAANRHRGCVPDLCAVGADHLGPRGGDHAQPQRTQAGYQRAGAGPDRGMVRARRQHGEEGRSDRPHRRYRSQPDRAPAGRTRPDRTATQGRAIRARHRPDRRTPQPRAVRGRARRAARFRTGTDPHGRREGAGRRAQAASTAPM
jgi:hypothetical protein